MSVLTPSSAFLFNVNPQDLYSSQSAFKKPNTLKKHKQTNVQCPGLNNARLSTVLEARQSRPSHSSSRIDELDLLISQPTKKVRVNHNQSYTKVQDNKAKLNKSSRLTIDEVFNTPSEPKQTCTGGFMIDECVDEGSSLSFISSYTSIDSLDEVIIIEENKKDEMMTNQIRNKAVAEEPLAVNDNIMSNLNNLLSSHLLNFNQPSVFQPSEFLQTLEWDEQNLLGNASQSLTIDPINISLTRLNEYAQPDPEFELLVKNALDMNDPGSKLKRLMAFGNEEDCSRSTSIEQSDKSHKSESPLYGSNFDVFENEKLPLYNQYRVKVPKTNKKNKVSSKVNKEKPKKAKPENKVTKVFPLNNIVQESEKTDILSNPVEVRLPVCSYADLPTNTVRESRRVRLNLEPVWNPETVNAGEFEEYFQQLSKVIGAPVTDEEAAVKLLKSFGMNASLTLEIAEQNQGFYREMFRVKVKRLRRNGI